jgi:aldose 1-epimerase
MILLLLLAACAQGAFAGPTNKFGFEQAIFGKMPDGTQVDLYTLTNSSGMMCKITTYGGILCELHVPDRKGKLADVVLGQDEFQTYLSGSACSGALIGRVANRIASGRFKLDGHIYTLAKNNGPNHLHGGIKGFDKVVWHAEPQVRADKVSLRLTYTSRDGEEGYPGTLKAVVTYTLSDKNELRLDYEATTDKATPVNLSNHTYWNLAGQGEILDHVLTVAANNYTPVDTLLIPTGKISPVKGTPLDFTSATVIGSRFGQVTNETLHGYDHNLVLNGGGKRLAFAARLLDPKSGRALEVWTDQPGVQLYTGNHLAGTKGKRNTIYHAYAGVCLETQNFPDFVNRPNFPSGILRPGRTYRRSTVFRFTAE